MNPSHSLTLIMNAASGSGQVALVLPADKCPTRCRSGSHHRESGGAGLALGRSVKVDLGLGEALGGRTGDGGAEGEGDDEGFPALGDAPTNATAILVTGGTDDAIPRPFIALLTAVQDAVAAPGEEAIGPAVVGKDIGIARTVVALFPLLYDLIAAERRDAGFEETGGGTTVAVSRVAVVAGLVGIEAKIAAGGIRGWIKFATGRAAVTVSNIAVVAGLAGIQYPVAAGGREAARIRTEAVSSAVEGPFVTFLPGLENVIAAERRDAIREGA